MKVTGILSVNKLCYRNLNSAKCIGNDFIAKVIADFGGRFRQDSCIVTSKVSQIDLDFSEKFVVIKTTNSVYFVVKEYDKESILEAFKRMVEVNYE